MLTALLALAAGAVPTVEPERLGPITRDCSFIEDHPGDGVNLEEVEAFADCLVEQQEPSPDDVERGVALFRLALGLSQEDTDAPPRRGDLRYQIVRAYGVNGDTQSMLREAEALSGFVDSAPSVRCDFFGRLAVEFEDWKQADAATRLADRFELSTCPRYVPRDGWSSDWKPTFYERWFGNQLLAMDERPFGEPGTLEGFARRFRLTVLPSFEPGYAVRIDQRGDGSAALHWVVLDGAGGYEPGRSAREGTVELSRPAAARMASALLEADLPSVAMEEAPPPASRMDNGDGTFSEGIWVCADGTAFLFEQLDPKRQVFVERGFCGPNDAEDKRLHRLVEEVDRVLPASFDPSRS